MWDFHGFSIAPPDYRRVIFAKESSIVHGKSIYLLLVRDCSLPSQDYLNRTYTVQVASWKGLLVSDPHVLFFFDVVSQLRSTVGDVVELVSDDQIPGFGHFVLASASCNCLKSNQYSVYSSLSCPFFVEDFANGYGSKSFKINKPAKHWWSPSPHPAPHLRPTFRSRKPANPGEASASTACRPTLRAPATSWARRPGPEAIAPPSHWKLGEKAGNCLEPHNP